MTDHLTAKQSGNTYLRYSTRLYRSIGKLVGDALENTVSYESSRLTASGLPNFVIKFGVNYERSIELIIEPETQIEQGFSATIKLDRDRSMAHIMELKLDGEDCLEAVHETERVRAVWNWLSVLISLGYSYSDSPRM